LEGYRVPRDSFGLRDLAGAFAAQSAPDDAWFRLWPICSFRRFLDWHIGSTLAQLSLGLRKPWFKEVRTLDLSGDALLGWSLLLPLLRGGGQFAGYRRVRNEGEMGIIGLDAQKALDVLLTQVPFIVGHILTYCEMLVRCSRPCRRIALFFPLLQPPSSLHFFVATSFYIQGVTWFTLALGRGQPPHRSFPSLNFHNTRVRRKPGGHVQTA
jgi:hypothetical protein